MVESGWPHCVQGVAGRRAFTFCRLIFFRGRHLGESTGALTLRSRLARGRLLRFQNLLDDFRFMLATILAPYVNAVLFDCKLYGPVHSKKSRLGPSPLDVLLAHINVVSGCDGIGFIDAIHRRRTAACTSVCCVPRSRGTSRCIVHTSRIRPVAASVQYHARLPLALFLFGEGKIGD